jgi:hypothetical protein
MHVQRIAHAAATHHRCVVAGVWRRKDDRDERQEAFQQAANDLQDGVHRVLPVVLASTLT